ncbi:MAG TPA: superoxide dismutase [Chthoniobacterales bacterium]
MITRRVALKTVTLTAGALALGPKRLFAEGGTPENGSATGGTYPFKVPDLPYAYDALEPYVDAQTMHLHHDKHHAAYVDNLNKALAEAGGTYQSMTAETLLLNLHLLPEKVQTVVRNNAGGHLNHTLFWPMLKKNEGGRPAGELRSAIDGTFGSFDAFQQQFSEAATKVFGSGWAWLVLDAGKLEITTTANQDNPVAKPREKELSLLGLDVWEHAYYLKYQNRRPEYVKAFWNIVNWDYANQRYLQLKS